jgi:RNAse (barnase) inhibitor barstar
MLNNMTQAIYYVNQSSVDRNLVKGESSKAFANIPEQSITIPMEERLNKETLLRSLAKACNFPSWFGHNWDAAWDCLTDSDIEYLTLDLTAVKSINIEDFNVFKSLIEDAFREFGKPQLWIVVVSDDLS